MIEFMTGRDARDLAYAARDYLDGLFGPVEFDEDMSIRESEFSDNDCKRLKFTVGIYEFSADLDKEFPIKEAVMPVVNLFHEVCGHGGQVMHEFDKDSQLSRVLALNYYACKSSRLYYGFHRDSHGERPTDQYYRQPHEIAAQYMGIKTAFEFLSFRFGSEAANHMVCEYVNFRIEKNAEFIDLASSEKLKRSGHPKHLSHPYTSVESVLLDFDKTFKRRVFEHREYDLNTYGKEAVCDDLLAYAMHSRVGNQLCVRAANSRNGVKQDLIMASAYLEENNKSGVIARRPVFKDMCLVVESVATLFSQPITPKPKKKDLCLHNLSGLDVMSGAESETHDYGYS